MHHPTVCVCVYVVFVVEKKKNMLQSRGARTHSPCDAVISVGYKYTIIRGLQLSKALIL